MRTPSQTVGPFFSIGLEHLGTQRSPAVGSTNEVRVQGRVLDGDGIGIPDAVLEIWYATPDGSYVGDGSRNFLRVFTDDSGAYSFTLTRPGRVPHTETTSQAPHVVVSLFMRGLLRHLITRVYFAGDPGNDTDPILTLVPAGRRGTLLAASSGDPSVFNWDIVMQGSAETVFFQC